MTQHAEAYLCGLGILEKQHVIIAKQKLFWNSSDKAVESPKVHHRNVPNSITLLSVSIACLNYYPLTATMSMFSTQTYDHEHVVCLFVFVKDQSYYSS